MCSHLPRHFTAAHSLHRGAAHERVTNITRRGFLTLLAGAVAASGIRARAASTAVATEVAGIALPKTSLARSAADLAHGACPDFLFNHSMRTYLLGALSLRGQQLNFDPEIAFVAAALHDLGLLPAFASARGSFEIDGANRAEELLHTAGRSSEQGRAVWNAIVMHDMRGDYSAHQSPEAQLVAAGAGADVVDPEGIDRQAVEEVVRAFPRLQFKTRFTALLVDHCRRKPTSQIGWLDGLCRATVPDAQRGSVERAIAQAPYTE
jgi:hypothetical protein